MIIFYVIMRFTVYGRSMYAIGGLPGGGPAGRDPGQDDDLHRVHAVGGGGGASRPDTALADRRGFGQRRAGLRAFGANRGDSGRRQPVRGPGAPFWGRCWRCSWWGVLANGLIQLNVPSFWIEVAQGALLVAAVTFDRVRLPAGGRRLARVLFSASGAARSARPFLRPRPFFPGSRLTAPLL